MVQTPITLTRYINLEAKSRDIVEATLCKFLNNLVHNPEPPTKYSY